MDIFMFAAIEKMPSPSQMLAINGSTKIHRALMSYLARHYR